MKKEKQVWRNHKKSFSKTSVREEMASGSWCSLVRSMGREKCWWSSLQSEVLWGIFSPADSVLEAVGMEFTPFHSPG